MGRVERALDARAASGQPHAQALNVEGVVGALAHARGQLRTGSQERPMRPTGGPDREGGSANQ